MVSYEVPENCRIGSKDYDADIIFVEQYVSVAKRTASKEEVISLFRTFQSKILEYITFTRKNIEQLKDAYYTVKNNPEVKKLAKMDYDDLRAMCKEDECPDLIKKIVNNYPLYNHLVNEERKSLFTARKFFESKDSRDNFYTLPGPRIRIPSYTTAYEQLTEYILPAMAKRYNEMDPENGMYYFMDDFIWDLKQNIPKIYSNRSLNLDLSYNREIAGLHDPKEIMAIFKYVIPNDPSRDTLRQEIADQITQSLEKYKYNKETFYCEYISCINEISEHLRRLSDVNCLKSPPIYGSINKVRPSEKGLSDKIKLSNGSGLFGLNTYLYALLNGYFLIGVPSQFSSYDATYNDCPGNFVAHDENHKDIIELDDTHLVFKEVYCEIIKDPKLTVHQKELMIMSIWSYIHESIYSPINLQDDPVKNAFSIKVSSDLYSEFFDEFRKFDDLLLTDDLYNEIKDKLIEGIKLEKSDPSSRRNKVFEIKFNSFEELKNYLQDSGIEKLSRGNLYFNLCMAYTLLIISKY